MAGTQHGSGPAPKRDNQSRMVDGPIVDDGG
jgi:hypothetical protein